MAVEEAIAAAREGRVALLVDAETTADEVVRLAGEGAVAVTAAALAQGAPAVGSGAPFVVVDGAEAVAGLVAEVWCGPWTLATWMRRCQPGAVLLLGRHAHPLIEEILGRHLALEVFGADAAEPPAQDADLPALTVEEVERAARQAAREPIRATAPDEAALLRDLALVGHLDEVWRAPFLVQIADHRRFKEPFVDDDEHVRRFHAAYDQFVGGLGMLEGARYQLHGRQPRDLRDLAEALGTPVHELAWVFRRMDQLKVVVSKPVEEGLGDRPNLEVMAGAAGEQAPTAEAAATAVTALRTLRAGLALSAEIQVAEREQAAEAPAVALFSSLKDAPAMPAEEAPPTPSQPIVAAEEPPPEPEPEPELPDHLPGLHELDRDELRRARALLAEVDGALRAEALLLAAFRYEWHDEGGRRERRYQIPDEVRDMALRSLELERVPAARYRETMDAEFPDAFVEMPRPGRLELFFEDGPLAGTHLLRELRGRPAFEAPLLEGVRARQARLEAGEAVDGDAGDPGWDALAETLRLRDDDRCEEALAALEEVDLDLDLAAIRETIVRGLPEDHEERMALERREAEARERSVLGEVLDGIERAITEGRRGEGEGFESLEQAASIGVLDRLADFLQRRSDDDPRDLGPALWLGRVEARRGAFPRAQLAYRRAARMLGPRTIAVQWRFELVESAFRGGGDDVAWETIEELLKDGVGPREMDQQIDRLFRAGVLSHRHHERIRDLFGERRLNKLSRTSRRLQQQTQMEPWKKALQGLKLEE